MTDLLTPLLQRVQHKNGEIDLAFLKETTYTETMDLSGPRLSLKFEDTHSIIRDYFQIETKDELTVDLVDHTGELNDSRTWIVEGMKAAEPLVVLNCFPKEVEHLKSPSVGARLFPQEGNTAQSILNELCYSGVAYDVDSVPLLSAYHVLPGDRPSRALRQLSLDSAASVWFSRGKVYLKDFSKLFQKAADIKYEWNNAEATGQIVQYVHLRSEPVLQDIIERNLIGWSMTDGVITGAACADKSLEWSPVQSEACLDNRKKFLVPVLDMVVAGYGKIAPGKNMEILWNLYTSDSQIDESLPTKIMVGAVSHYSTMMNYYCRVRGVIPRVAA